MDLEEYRNLHAGKNKNSKYKAVPTHVDGIRFASKLEAERYSILLLSQKAGIISNLKLQVRYKLTVNSLLIATYIADFTYHENGIEVVEDAKGVKTDTYKLKKKLMKAVFNIDIRETYKNEAINEKRRK